MTADVVRGVRHALGIRPVYKTVDTCAAEFAARTPYHYSSYDEETEVQPREKPAVIILGSGPNRIGQGIEFDYSCVHASMALSERRLRDRDGQLQPRDGLHRLRHQRPAVLRAADPGGRAGGRARGDAGRPGRGRHLPARRADAARASPRASRTPGCGSSARRPLPSTSPRSAEPSAGCWPVPDCPRRSTGWPRRSSRRRRSPREIGYPVLVRPSYVLGGRGMEIVYDDPALESYIERATAISPRAPGPRRPVHRRRGRDRRGRPVRRHRPVPRRRDGAHRGGRHPLRRLVVRAAADHPRGARDQPDPGRDRGHRRRRGRARAAQRAVRAGLRRALRARGQPPRQPDRAVRVQGDRHPAGQRRCPGDARRVRRGAACRGGAARDRRRRRPARERARSRSRRR